MNNEIEQFCNQATSPPIDSSENFDEYINKLKNITRWEHLGILTDENIQNTIILFISSTKLVGAMRLSLEPKIVIRCLKSLIKDDDTICYRCIQGYLISGNDILSLEAINTIWNKAKFQSTELTSEQLEPLFIRFENNRKEKGRGPNFTKETKETVWRESFGRCMFTGCGEKLDCDELSGNSGNFAYLAHNVASSEQSSRGIIELSKKLSNDPNNILLLCDKHHRLIDKVAASDYTAPELSAMREEFTIVANSLLDGLKYQPIPVYAVLWPVNSQTISPPSDLQIANSLSRIKRRIHEQINVLSNNEELLIESPNILWSLMPNIIKNAAEKIIQQTKQFGYNAALFGFGPTSALIGLGAKLGNKNAITPMLRLRETGSWSWPSINPIGDFYEIEGYNNLQKNNHFVINIAFTAEPEILTETSKIVSQENNAHRIIIRAKDNFMGNGSIPHPEDGRAFSAYLQSLFHELKSKYDAKIIHLFPCVSNAASIFIGQAYDVHHPKVIVYDFDNQAMVPRIYLESKDHQCLIKSVLNTD